MPFIPKDWQDRPSVATPISSAALEDLETRLSAYTDSQIQTVGGNTGAGLVGDPMAHGAVGNGVADDTAVIQTTINAVTAGGTGVLDLTHSPKTYKISAPLVLPDNGMTVWGRNFNREGNATQPPLDLTCSSIFTGAAAITNQSANATTSPATTGQGCCILGVTIEMAAATTGSGIRSGIRLQGGHMVVEKCFVSKPPGIGIHLCNVNVGGFSLTNSNFCTDNQVNFNQVSRHGVSGIRTDQGSNITDSWVMFNKISGSCIAYGDPINNTGPGLHIKQAEDWVLIGNHVEHNAQDGLVCENCSQLRLIGNYVNQFGQAAAASTTYRGIYFNSIHADGAYLSGNTSRLDEGGTQGGGTGGAAQMASATILYYVFTVDDVGGPTVLVRVRDNIAYQFASGPSTAIAFKANGSTVVNRTLKLVGDGNVAIGAQGAISPATVQNVSYSGTNLPTWVNPNFL